ncbi:hypothetical protein [Streptomyces phaeochromogenes]|uniref:hypothetical protein n=1 Tax=Streptomyces phaeochromogenes TaxID=1923 RepID=UPI0036762C41
MPAQRCLLETLGIQPAAEGEAVGPVRQSQDEQWAANVPAAHRFHAREGHLRPACKHVENVDGAQAGQEGSA